MKKLADSITKKAIDKPVNLDALPPPSAIEEELLAYIRA